MIDIRQHFGSTFLVNFLFTVSVCVSPARADDGWEREFENGNSSIIHLRRYQNKTYYLSTQFQATYLEALTFCKHIHMTLLTIHSDEENQIIHKYIREANKGTEYWTAGTRLIDGFQWLWLPYAQKVNFTKWSVGQPSDVNEKCLQLWEIGGRLEWNDRHCDTRFYFICER